MRTVIEEQRKRAGALARVEDRHAGGERNFGRVGAKSFTFELDGAEDVVIGDAEFQIGALEDIGKRGKIGFLAGTIGEGEEAIVLVERKSDVAGWRQRRFEALLSECGKSECEYQNGSHRQSCRMSDCARLRIRVIPNPVRYLNGVRNLLFP